LYMMVNIVKGRGGGVLTREKPNARGIARIGILPSSEGCGEGMVWTVMKAEKWHVRTSWPGWHGLLSSYSNFQLHVHVQQRVL
jgi:hypothetical protein